MIQPEIGHVAGIAAELLVRALADLHDFHAAVVGELGDEVKRDANPIGDRFVLVVDHLFQIVDHVFLLDDDLVVIGLESLCDRVRVLEFVEMLMVAKADREGLHGIRRVLAHQRDVGRGIDAAGEEDAKRHVGHHAFLNAGAQTVADAPDVKLLERGFRQTGGLRGIDAVARHRIPVTRSSEPRLWRRSSGCTRPEACRCLASLSWAPAR